eukprot:TRINITY_DN13106_c0_g1_i1.p1 TRINITY_DN13106_c0_g1~~TRINITY_DN13106_c0_g1_i1.p1  ORF type:complete len:339 (+),score=40.45 TRINITY_DN13106_c0_g1_i1:162-1178(+)
MTFGIVFDIDGVVRKSGVPLSAALRVFAVLKAHNERCLLSAQTSSLAIPFVFLTNGGGVTEAQYASMLEKQLSIPVSEFQMIESHTPMRELASAFADKRVLLIGVNNYEISAAYGLRRAITIQDFVVHHPHLVPKGIHAVPDVPLQPPEPDCDPIAAILVLEDPHDWHAALQVSLDLLETTGVVGGPAVCEQQVQIHFSNPDFVYASLHSRPRITQGAFKLCIEAIYQQATGRQLQSTQYGKPCAGTYGYAERLLRQTARNMCGRDDLSAIYMIGDNPLSDIRGANWAGEPWISILVRTGVFQSSAANDPDNPAKMVCADIEEAFRWLCDREQCNLGT